MQPGSRGLCFLGGIFEDYSPGDLLSGGTEGLFQRGKGGLGYGGGSTEKINVVEHQNMTASQKKIQTSPVNGVSAFPCMGRCASLCSLKQVLRYAPYHMTNWYLRSVSYFSASSIPSGCIMGTAAVAGGLFLVGNAEGSR